MPGFHVHHQPPELTQTMPSNHLILCRLLLLPPSMFPSIRVFPHESVLCFRWPKYWSFSISPSNEYSGLISFRIDWLDLLVVQGTLESPPTPQFKSINLALSFLYSPTHIHPYMTTGRTLTLTRWTFFFFFFTELSLFICSKLLIL